MIQESDLTGTFFVIESLVVLVGLKVKFKKIYKHISRYSPGENTIHQNILFRMVAAHDSAALHGKCENWHGNEDRLHQRRLILGPLSKASYAKYR